MKYLLILILLGFGVKFGADYLQSAEFQAYADENKLTWTCTANNLIGNFYVMMSNYEYAQSFFVPVLKRCEKSAQAEEAEFKIALCYENLGNNARASESYKKFAENWKNSPRARLALRSAQLLGGL